MSTAIRLLTDYPHHAFSVSVIAELTGDETTSRGAGGLWKPYSLGRSVQCCRHILELGSSEVFRCSRHSRGRCITMGWGDLSTLVEAVWFLRRSSCWHAACGCISALGCKPACAQATFKTTPRHNTLLLCKQNVTQLMQQCRSPHQTQYGRTLCQAFDILCRKSWTHFRAMLGNMAGSTPH